MREPKSARWLPWRAAFRDVFTLAARDWTPPQRIKTTVNGRRDRITWEARFRQPDGTAVSLVVISRREGEEWFVVEQNLDLRLKFEVVR